MYLTKEEFDRHLNLARKNPRLVVDTEGTLNHPYSETWGASLSSFGMSDYFAFNHKISHPTSGENLPKPWLAELKDVIENHDCLVFHNAKHDLRALRSLGINYTGKFYDTQLMAHMVNENWPSKELDWLGKVVAGGHPKNMSDVMRSIIDGFGWPFVPVDMMRSYADNDAFITEILFNTLLPDFEEQGFEDLWQDEQDFARLLGKIEDVGLVIDQDLSQREYEKGIKIMKELRKELGFNPNSPKQLGKFLIEDLGLPELTEFRTETGNLSFGKEAMAIYDVMLSQRGDKRAKQIMAYRGWMKTTSSNYKPYLERLYPEDGRFHPSFKQHGTKTGRLSCGIMHQIPRESSNEWNGHTKAAITTEDGRIAIEFDYSQLEFRLGAAYGNVTKLIEIFNDPSRDVFNEMASQLGMTRQNTKTLNYTIQFGGRAKRLSQVFGVSIEQANDIIYNKYFGQYPGLDKIAKYTETVCRERGFIKYWTRRRRHITNKNECRKAFNSLCQGGAFEIVKQSMLAIDRAGLNNDECQMDLQVHDSIRFSIERGKEHIYVPEIKAIMEDVKRFHDFGVKFAVEDKEWAKESKELIAA